MNKARRDLLLGTIKTGLALGAGAVVTWAKRPASGQPAAKAPPRPYGTVEIVTTTQTHQSGVMPRVGSAPSAADDLKHYATYYTAQVTVAALTDLDHDAVEAVERLQRYLDTTAAAVALRALGMVYAGPSGAARDVSSFGDAAWEGRAEVDLGFRWVVEWTADEGVIEAASFDLDLDGTLIQVDVEP